MALTFPRPSGLSDIDDATFNQDKPVYGSHIQAIHENSAFGAVRVEVFHGNYRHGDVVPLPVSAVDGYSYERSELIYVHEFANSANPDTGRVENKGQLRWFWKRIDPDTGEVRIIVSYKVRGGKTTDTNDGLLSVSTVGVRGRGDLSIAVVPIFFDINDNKYDLDSAMTQLNMKRLNLRAKLSVVVPEVFDLGEFADGDTVTAPTSDVDGYVYSHAETVYLPVWIWTVKDSVTTPEGDKSERSGVGTIRELTTSVNSGTGAVDTSVRYRKNDLLTTDGRVRVVAFCTRSGLSLAAEHAAWTTVDDSKLLPFSGQSMEDATLVAINRNSKFSLMRPEVFVDEYANAASIPTPVSPIDGYAYASSEMVSVYTYVTSTPKTGIGQLTQLRTFVSATLPFISTLYKRSGDSDWVKDGKVRVVTLAYRSEVVTSPVAGPSAKGGGTKEDDLAFAPHVINGDFSNWSELTEDETVKIADYWEETDDSSGATYTQDLTSAQFGIAVQKIAVPTGGGNVGGIVSNVIPVKPGQLIRLVTDLLASVATTDGATVRVHLLNSDESSSVYFDLFADQAVPVTLIELNAGFLVPADTDTTVVVTGGTAAVVGTLDFDPVLAQVEIRFEDPNVTSTFSVDRVLWFLMDENFFDVEDRVLEPTRLLGSHVSYRSTTNPLTGSGTTVTVAAFTMRVAGNDISVSGGSVTSLTNDVLYYIYYDDDGFVGGSVTYFATTTRETAIDATGRFFVGSIKVPASGAADTVGNNDGGSGAQWGQQVSHSPLTAAFAGDGTTTNVDNGNDDDWGTFGEKDVVGIDTEVLSGTYKLSDFSPGGNLLGRKTVRVRVKYRLTAQVVIGIPTVTASIAIGSFSDSVSQSSVGTDDTGVLTATVSISLTDIDALVLTGTGTYTGNAASDRASGTVAIYECKVVEEA